MKRFFFFITFLTLFISIPFSPSAQTQTEETTLEEVVVTATRDVQEIRKVPANVTVVTKEEIERSNAQTVIDTLRHENGVIIRDVYGTGKTASIDIRGFGESAPQNVLVLVDGRRVNEIDLSGVDFTQIPLDQVERIEIVRGPSSVLYGDNAAGGVINIITKKPEKPFSARAEGAIGSHDFYKVNSSVSGKWGPFSAIINAGRNATDGYRDNGFLRTVDVGGKLIYDLNENISFNLNGGLHKDDAGLPGGLTKEDIDRYGRRATLSPDDKVETEDGYGSWGVKAKLGGLGRIEAELSYRNREVKDFFKSYNFEDKRILATWGVTPRYIIEKPLWKFRNKLTLGVDFYKSNSEVDSESAFGSNRSEVSKKSIGLYALDEFFILENLVFTAGLRNEWVNYDLLQENPFLKDKVKDREPAWNLGLDYLFAKRSSAFLSVKRSFRFPVTDELVQFVYIYPDLVARVNPSMKPQTGYSYEAGIRHAFSDQIEASLTFFRIENKDEIFYNPMTFTNENLPKTRRQGIETGAKAKPFKWLTVWGNYSHIRPKLREEPLSGNDIPWVPRHKGSVGADVEFIKGFLFNTRINAVGSRRLISDWGNRFSRLDGYCTLDMRLSYSWKGLKAFVGINNVTDRKYSEYGATSAYGTRQVFYPSPERSFVGGISYTF